MSYSLISGSSDRGGEIAGSSSKRHVEDTIRYTSCDGGCFRQCILKVRVRDGVIVACEPDDTINPGIPREDGHLPDEVINRGIIQARPCAKGYAQAQMIYDPNRLKYPMKRVGRRGEAKFERISWDEALDTIAKKLVEMKENYGPFSILHHPYSVFGRSSFPLAPWFGAGIAGWAAHSDNGFDEPENWVLGKDLAKSYSSREWFDLLQDEVNIFKSRLIVLWGLNPLSTLSGGWAYNLLRAKEQGIPIICIEPRYTPSVEVLADQWIPIRPTTDVAMMIAMANIWFKEDLCDKEFVEKWVELEGLRRWKAYVLGADDGIDKTPRWAENICGVPAETIEAFARLYASSKPVNLNVSMSIGRQFYGENPTRAAMYLQALTGNTCILGGTAVAETGKWLGQLPMSVPIPVVDWQRKPRIYEPPVLLIAYKWPKAINMREKLDKGEISKKKYNETIGNAAGNPSPSIQMLILEECNHLNSLPDINSTIRALKKVDFVVVFSHYAELPAARYADILLPQIYRGFEGRTCQYGGGNLFKVGKNLANYFMYCQKCVEPVGEVKSGPWVWTQIAKRLGIAELYSPRLANVPDDRWDEVVEDLHREAYERWAVREEIAPLNPPSWEEFQKKPVFRWEIKDPYYSFKRDLESGENPFRGTASGKIEFYSKGLAKGPDYLAANEFFPGSGKCYGGGSLPPMAQMTMGGRDTFHSKDTEKYPLLMSSPHSLYRVHSFMDNNLWLRDDCYRHAVWINVSDAKVRGIVDDDLVKVYNDIGEMIIPAYVTLRIVPGTVCVFHGAWYVPGGAKSPLMPDGIDRGGAPSFLIHDEDLPMTIIGMQPCKGLVQVEKWEGT